MAASDVGRAARHRDDCAANDHVDLTAGSGRGHGDVVLSAGARLAQRVAAGAEARDIYVDRPTVQRDRQRRASGLHRHRPHATADVEL
jgi:hypothetical protein